MSIERSPRVDRDTAEQLVAGKGVGPVASVLRAAAAPAHRDELSGEDAAVAAFRTAPIAVPARHSVFRKAIAKALTIKAVIVLAIAGSTGIVLAASEGALPVPWSNSPADPPASTTTTSPAPNPTGTRTSDGRQPPANPDPSIVGLCEAYAAHEDKNLDNPAFRELVEAAGGKDKVAGYCETAEDARTSGSAEPGTPSEPGEPGEGKAPTLPPTSVPTDLPDVPEPPVEPGRPDGSGKPDKTRVSKSLPTKIPAIEDTVTRTPGSLAPGAATAVPPSGAEPPSTGG